MPAWELGWASGVPQCSIYPGVGDRLAVIQAFGVDAQKDFDTVPGPLGDSRRGDTGKDAPRSLQGSNSPDPPKQPLNRVTR
jgi:hypothetical protein